MVPTLLNPTTDANGQATAVLNSSNVVDTTNASDDYSSNGLIVWDPLSEVIGTATIVIDLSLTPVDLIAQSDAIIVTRNVTVLNQFLPNQSATTHYRRLAFVFDSNPKPWPAAIVCYNN